MRLQQIAHTALTAGTEADLQRHAFEAPWLSLAAGWYDLWRVPRISLGYGAAFAAVAMALTSATANPSHTVPIAIGDHQAHHRRAP